MSAGRAGRPKNPPKPLEAWYTVLARAWGTYAFTQSDPTHIEQPKTIWRQNDLAFSNFSDACIAPSQESSTR